MDNEKPATVDDADQPARKRLRFSKTKLLAGGMAVGGMIIGALVGIGVQLGVESTGVLGPSVENLMAEQASNFDAVNKRLNDLKQQATDPAVKASLAELGSLLQKNGKLNEQASAELRSLGEQVSTLKDQALAKTGYAGGADFWMKAGESVSIGNRSQVLGLLGARSTFADINLNGKRQRMNVGDALPVPGDDASCTVFYKIATPREDGRVGFDLNCA